MPFKALRKRGSAETFPGASPFGILPHL